MISASIDSRSTPHKLQQTANNRKNQRGLPFPNRRCHNQIVVEAKSSTNSKGAPMWHCYYCRLALSLDMQRKHQLCPGCGSDIHSCRNCINFESSRNQCSEANSPWVADRAATNECQFFEFRPTTTAASPPNQEASNTEAEKAKEAFRALFRNV